MAGTRTGGLKTTKTVKSRYGKDHYKKIGAMGGMAKGPDYQKGGKKASGFAAHPELAKIAGAKGGKASRKTGPNKKKMISRQTQVSYDYTSQPNPAML